MSGAPGIQDSPPDHFRPAMASLIERQAKALDRIDAALGRAEAALNAPAPRPRP